LPEGNQPLTVDSIVVADAPAAWRDAGFRVDDAGHCQIGTILLRIAPDGSRRGLAEWSVRGLATTELDGLPTELSTAPQRQPAEPHPNGVTTVDHVVAFTPDRARTAAALEAAGLQLRRLRDEPTPGGGGHQAFFRLGEAILEVIEHAAGSPQSAETSAPARFWGLALALDSFDAASALLGDGLSAPRDAVQPGRQIATLRRSAGLAVPIAFMTPGPGAV
jgi:hypothetical protein